MQGEVDLVRSLVFAVVFRAQSATPARQVLRAAVGLAPGGKLVLPEVVERRQVAAFDSKN